MNCNNYGENIKRLHTKFNRPGAQWLYTPDVEVF
jgi:hypothetical protein